MLKLFDKIKTKVINSNDKFSIQFDEVISSLRAKYKSDPIFLNRKETLESALKNEQSIARYGDGEIDMVLYGRYASYRGISFQKSYPLLVSKLSETLFQQDDRVLVCLNGDFLVKNEYRVVLNYEKVRKEYARFESIKSRDDIAIMIRNYEQKRYLRQFKVIKSKTSIPLFGESTCFTLGFFYDEYIRNSIPEILQLYRKLFYGRKLLIVCPEEPLIPPSFGDLFAKGIIESPKTVEIMNIPSRDCFYRYPYILKEILSHKHIDTVLIQGGPTATVLAAELAVRYGLLAYDVGSLNVSLWKAHAHDNWRF